MPDPNFSPSASGWDPVVVSADLSSKLSSRARHINLILGAGTSRPAGLPDMKGLIDLILAELADPMLTIATDLFATYGLEDGLSRVRRIRALLGVGETFGDFTPQIAEDLDVALSAAIIKHLSIDAKDMAAHNDLASWVVGEYYTMPIEIFTTNYDLLIENGLEFAEAAYADGFVGNINASFSADIVEATGSASDVYPASFARLWKIHGSLNWKINDRGQVIRMGESAKPGDVAAIYPSDEKYDHSRRVPFTILQDRLRRAMAIPESVTLISGYSFSDQHLNEIVFDAAARYPRSEIVVLCYSELYPEARGRALANMTMLGGTEAMIGGVTKTWAPPVAAPDTVWRAGKFTLGDFAALASFLSRTSRSDREDQRMFVVADPKASTA